MFIDHKHPSYDKVDQTSDIACSFKQLCIPAVIINYLSCPDDTCLLILYSSHVSSVAKLPSSHVTATVTVLLRHHWSDVSFSAGWVSCLFRTIHQMCGH